VKANDNHLLSVLRIKKVFAILTQAKTLKNQYLAAKAAVFRKIFTSAGMFKPVSRLLLSLVLRFPACFVRGAVHIVP